MKKTSNVVARPRAASSLVIFRKKEKKIEVLMGRRGSKARFKPGVYVFPGGLLERTDYRITPKTNMPKKHLTLMGIAGSQSYGNALGMAAIREAYEEVGLKFGIAKHSEDINKTNWTTNLMEKNNIRLNELVFLGRAITPSPQPLRFHARFFGMPFEKMSGKIQGDGELEDLRWVDIKEKNSLHMMQVQHMIIETLERYVRYNKLAPKKLFFKWNKINIVNC